VRVDLRIDVRDAMGANILNSAAEHLRPYLEQLCGGRALMCILGNAAEERRAGARFALPLEALPQAAGPQGGMAPSCKELARRIVSAGELAREDPQRAVTHNKGIMNGITSLALATMNDTRAVEAAAHAWAARDGRYRSLSSYRCDGRTLEGELELPLPLATVGGAVGFHPASRLALKVLGRPDARRLARIAAALGLAQNLAALLALVSGGIQRGHMRYHAARLAYQAGARGGEVRLVAERLAARRAFNREEAAAELRRLRGEQA
jgi:hydroxymethylglutaryl-CoA reductase